jgi:predicted RNA-binding protein with PUA domain
MKATEILDKAKELLSIETQVEEVKLAQATLENGTIIEAESMEAGKEVFIVTEDEKVALPIGEYTLEDGKMLVIEEEGIIASIGEAEAEAPEEEVEAALEDNKEEMEYATKQELSEIREMVEEIKAMISDKEEMSADTQAEEAVENIVEEVKEELAAETPVEKVNHNPEASEEKTLNLYSQKRANTTLDRVLGKFGNFNK